MLLPVRKEDNSCASSLSSDRRLDVVAKCTACLTHHLLNHPTSYSYRKYNAYTEIDWWVDRADGGRLVEWVVGRAGRLVVGGQQIGGVVGRVDGCDTVDMGRVQLL